MKKILLFLLECFSKIYDFIYKERIAIVVLLIIVYVFCAYSNAREKQLDDMYELGYSAGYEAGCNDTLEEMR